MLNELKRRLLDALPPAVAGSLRALRVRQMIATYSPKTVEHTYGSVRLKVRLTDPLSAGWYDHDWATLPEIEVLKASALSPGAIVFDIGAHQGVVAMMIGAVVGPTGKVVVCEPSAHNLETARQNAQLNGMTQMEFIEAAIADRDGPIVFSGGLNGQLDDGSGSAGRVRVEGITLDRMAERFGMPGVVFLDVEGAEGMALSGGTCVLDAVRACCVEVHVGCGLEHLGGSVGDILRYFDGDQWKVSVRREEDLAFVPLGIDDSILARRFFLLAERA
jgi:FkbM family methyltransferase